MKKILVILLFALLMAPFIFAQDDIETSEDSNEVEDVYQNKAGIPEFTLPLWFFDIHFPGFYINFTWAELVVYLMAAAFIFVGALEILSFTALETWWTKTLIAGCLVVMAYLTRSITKLSAMFFHFHENFRFFAWLLLILVIAALFIKPIMAAVKRKNRLEKAKDLGRAAGVALRGFRNVGRSAAKANQ